LSGNVAFAISSIAVQVGEIAREGQMTSPEIRIRNLLSAAFSLASLMLSFFGQSFTL
jgi:hypothetical protein